RINPEIVTDYFCRDSLPRLAQQFFRYGRAKAYTLHKHGGLPSARALAPAALLSTMAGLAIGSTAFPRARRVLAALVGTYVMACALGGAVVGAKRGWRHAPLLPVVFMVLHVSHGA